MHYQFEVKQNPLLHLNMTWKKGGSSTTVIQPTPPAQPTTGQSIAEWLQYAPQVFAQQQAQAPQEAALQMQLAQQYALPYAQIMKQANDAMYPTTAALQENMANQATSGMNATEMPEWMKQQTKSDMNANLGTNVGSPIGADYVSRGMQNQLFQQQKYYRDLGLSLAGRQPLTQAAAPATTNYASTFTPSAVMGNNAQNYSTFASATRPLTGQKTESSYLWGLF